MRDFVLIAAAILFTGGVILLIVNRPRRTLAGDMDSPMDVERARAKSEAAMAAPVTAADEEAAAPLVAYVEEIGSGEFPSLAFDADPLGAPIPDGFVRAEPAFFADVTADWLSAFSWAAEPAVSVPLASVHLVEPDPYEALGFTQGWKAADVERMVAEAKAAAA